MRPNAWPENAYLSSGRRGQIRTIQKMIDTIKRLPETTLAALYLLGGYMREIKRGEIYYASLDNAIGSEQQKNRPVLILQNDIGNLHSPTTIVAVITTKNKKMYLPCHIPVTIDGENCGIAALEQIRTIDKCRLTTFVGKLDRYKMKRINRAIKISLGLIPIDEIRKGVTYGRTNNN